MEKRVVIAVFLSFAIIILYQILFAPTPPPHRENKAAAVKTVKKEAPAVPEKKIEKKAAPPPPPAVTVPVPSTGPAQDVVVDTRLARIVFTTKGGRISHYFLKIYKKLKGGGPIDLVEDGSLAQEPLSLKLPSAADTELANNGIYAPSQRQITVEKAGQRAQLTFTLRTNSGDVIQKQFVFQGDKYLIQSNVSVTGPKGESEPVSIFWGPGIRDDSNGGRTRGYEGPVALADGKLVKEKLEAGAPPTLISGDVKWAALQTKYFVVAFLAQTGQEGVFVENPAKKASVGLSLPAGTGSFGLYAGPKEHRRLEALGVGLQRIIDYGWFSFLAKPLLDLLIFFYGLTGNYGLAIIVLTAFIKVLFYPLTQKSFKSMQKMQILQPKIKKLQQLYKNDKQRMNQEVMGLYREHKMNPMGGCLPMLLQIPVFFALYYVLLDAIELRQAPFFWWITDLSAKDPYYIWPLLMGVSMFVQQKMSPSMADPMQAKIMLLMPIIFTFMFLNFPVGLVIYWLVNNVLTIAQQYYMNRQMAREQAAA